MTFANGPKPLRRNLIIAALSTALTLKVGSVIYAGQFGPPEPATQEGKVGLGVGYFSSSTKLDPEHGNRLARQHEVRSNQIHLEAGYGFIKNWEAFVRVAASDLTIDDALPFASLRGLSDTFKDSFRPSGTLGLRGLLYKGAYFALGPFFQASLLPNYEDRSGTYIGGPPACDIDPTAICLAIVGSRSDQLKVKHRWDVNLGMAFQTHAYGITFYGGPLVYWTGYKAEYTLNFDGDPPTTDQTLYREKDNFGGFAGLRMPLPWMKRVNLEIEAQFKSKASAGISLNYSF